jgi:tetratricopeptide (TPR) repeat protein
MRTTIALAIAIVVAVPAFSSTPTPAPDSARLGRAKDYMADEQWPRAIAELRAAINDPKEKAKDEALYWLAHSLNQSGDSASAIETIRRLESEYPKSLWVKPAGSLRVDIAIHLRRNDVLWWTAVPPQPARMPTRARKPAPPPPVAEGANPATVPAPPEPPAPAPTAVPTPRPPYAPPPAPLPPKPPAWFPEDYQPDIELRIQALGSLIRTDALKVIPILTEIALDSDNPGDARRAMFVMMQSGKPEARAAVVQVAKAGPEFARVAAVRELGRFGGPEISQELMQVYTTADLPVKQQVVTSLGERLEKTPLFRIAQSEKDPGLRESAILKLAQAGGSEQLWMLYERAEFAVKLPIIVGFFSAGAEDELIRVAEHERDPKLRAEALRRLRLMETPKAKEYLQKLDRQR